MLSAFLTLPTELLRQKGVTPSPWPSATAPKVASLALLRCTGVSGLGVTHRAYQIFTKNGTSLLFFHQ